MRDEAWRRAQGEAIRRLWKDPGYRARVMAGRVGPEQQARKVEAGLHQFEDPDYARAWEAGVIRAGKTDPASQSEAARQLWETNPAHRRRWKRGMKRACQAPDDEDEEHRAWRQAMCRGVSHVDDEK